MTLKIELKPGERILLGDCVITNGGRRTRLAIDGTLPILREKDIMSLRRADTPATWIYLADISSIWPGSPRSTRRSING